MITKIIRVSMLLILLIISYYMYISNYIKVKNFLIIIVSIFLTGLLFFLNLEV